MPSHSSKHLFCFGLGYVGTALSESLLQSGWKVSGTVRTEDKRAKLIAKGFEVFCEQELAAIESAIQSASHILITVPPTREGDASLLAHQSIVSALPDLRWLGYLSSTIVYGDKQGAWVDEETPVAPNNDRGHRRVQAEQQWMSSGLAWHIFRIAGIYGPTRNAMIKLQNGTSRAVAKKEHVSCRIHIDDIVAALTASMTSPDSGNIYNLADDEPTANHEVIRYAAQLLGIGAPKVTPIEDANLSPMALSFYDGCRRVSNDKVKRELSIRLKYPSYRQGLKAMAQDF